MWPVPSKKFTKQNQFQRTALTSWINALLVCVPVGLCLNYVKGGSAETFAFNYLAEFPLWFMCDYALEEIEKYIGPTASDILDIFTTNTVQVLSSYLLLRADKVSLLQTSLVGAILSNILFLLGLSYLLGGMRNHKQAFNGIGAQGASCLLSIAATSILIPTAAKHFHQTTPKNLVRQSRGVAFVLLFVYSTYMACQMKTHKQEYRQSGRVIEVPEPVSSFTSRRFSITNISRSATVEGSEIRNRTSVQNTQRSTGIPLEQQDHGAKEEEESEVIEGVHLHLLVAVFVFAVSIVLLYFCIDATVGSIAALAERTSLSPTFVGLILLPIPNCDFAPISLAVDDCAEETIKYTVGRSIQTALLVEPAVVLFAWALKIQDVTLAFDGFQVVSVVTTILLLNFLVVDACVHWIHGMLLLADFALIAIAAFFETPEKF